MKKISCIASLAWLTAALVPLADAQDKHDRAIAGIYSLGGVYDGDPFCTVRLNTETALGGLALELDKKCYQYYPFPEDTFAWGYDHATRTITFYDVFKKVVTRFKITGEGDYVSPEYGKLPSLVIYRKSPPARRR